MNLAERSQLLHLRCFGTDEQPAGEPFRTLHFIRHGEATHQERAQAAAAHGQVCRCDEPGATEAERRHCPYLDPELIDAPLTPRGRLQVLAAAATGDIELVLSAPSRRALQTAIDACSAAAGDSTSAQTARGAPRIVALETLRARISAHAHSRRLSATALRTLFPQVDFSDLTADEDQAWSPTSETRASLDARAARFLRFLCTCPEQRILIVTHFTVFLALLQPAAQDWIIGRNLDRPDDDPPLLDWTQSAARERLAAPLQVGEVRSLRVLCAPGARS